MKCCIGTNKEISRFKSMGKRYMLYGDVIEINADDVSAVSYSPDIVVIYTYDGREHRPSPDTYGLAQLLNEWRIACDKNE